MKFALIAILAVIMCSPVHADRVCNPGHYVQLPQWMTPANYNNSNNLNDPDIQGIIVEIGWGWVHTEVNGSITYDFTLMNDWYDVAETNGHRIIYKIMDRDFNSGNQYMPNFLTAGTHYSVNKSCSTCYTAHRWNVQVQWAKFSFNQAVAGEFHTETNGIPDYPLIEGVAFIETSMGLGWYQPQAGNFLHENGYTPDNYVDAIKAVFVNARAFLPDWQIFQYVNSISGKGGTTRLPYLREIADGAESVDVVYGNPDILPERSELPEGVYPIHREYQDTLQLFTSAQYDSQKADAGNDINNSTGTVYTAYFPNGGSSVWQPSELITYADERLHVDYMFWNYDQGPSGTAGGPWKTKPTAFDAMADRPELGNKCD